MCTIVNDISPFFMSAHFEAPIICVCCTGTFNCRAGNNLIITAVVKGEVSYCSSEQNCH